jgi:hypothetical protein
MLLFQSVQYKKTATIRNCHPFCILKTICADETAVLQTLIRQTKKQILTQVGGKQDVAYTQCYYPGICWKYSRKTAKPELEY